MPEPTGTGMGKATANATKNATMQQATTTYQQVGGDLNVYVCDLLANGYRTPIMEWLLGRISKFSNLNHKCPYADNIYFKADNISVDEFSYPDLMPSAQYRLDITLFENMEKILATFYIYFIIISDHRIDVQSLKL
ncbi:hypothetical protein HA402_002664 [Bradysia odoriphaga]|nr:hypothetical protein HA402_002664 [Bradysia odoriphaga]